MKKEIKKVGIFTINDDGNFGNRLQNYAVQEILKKYNIQVKTIRKESLLSRIKNNLKICIKKILPQNKYKRQINFNQFNKNIKFKYYKKDKELDKINKQYDYFFTGSDQVWNPNFKRMSDTDFLTFAPNQKKISFSASLTKSLINNYPHIRNIALCQIDTCRCQPDQGIHPVFFVHFHMNIFFSFPTKIKNTFF